MNVILLDFSSVHNTRDEMPSLAQGFAACGHHVCLLVHGAQNYEEQDGIDILPLALSGFFSYDFSPRGWWHLRGLSSSTAKSIRQHHAAPFDLVVAVDPPPTARRLIPKLLNGSARGYVMVGEPPLAAAVEAGALTPRSLATRHYASHEQQLYALFDRIACTGDSAAAALRARCPELPAGRLVTAPVVAVPGSYPDDFDKTAARERFGLPHDTVVCVYDGPMTAAAGIDFFHSVLTFFSRSSDVFFAVMGDGDLQPDLRRHIEQEKRACAKFFEPISRDEHIELLRACDIGLVLQAHNAVPCPPSRIVPYLDLSLPILAAGAVEDVARVLEETGCGFATTQTDPRDFLRHLNVLVKSREQREAMGRKGRRLLECDWTVDRAARQILESLESEQ